VDLPPVPVLGGQGSDPPSTFTGRGSNRSPGSAAAGRLDGQRLEFFGAERVLYGTDFPTGSNNGEDWPVEVLDTIRALGLNAADHKLSLGANLHRIMRL
jgi:predicted TIM-barrel fold metal-dependent hydrolase